MNQRKPDALDIAVGQRIRVERLARRMSQSELAQRIGISFQQLQKYERGLNRIGAGRLSRIAEALDIPVRSLIEVAVSMKPLRRKEGGASGQLIAMLTQPGAVRALRAFVAIPARLQPFVISLLEKLAVTRPAGRAARRSPPH